MKNKSNPLDTIIETIAIFAESQYEDSDIEEAELELAKRRFRSALQYLIITTMEAYNEEVKIQSDTSSQHNA